ncbi:hypothetical protein H0H81_008651 [Sphagnurus paluster]|uniref:Nephrocystin 3-like N-terminal domain-containing protein n=1 Tax=Sphagnurus paluster TaxID=117069 RepID=A0A9P7FQD4_9AGAR|nr:hypothetical protein H0H81_008651 [Sphagnurus paluster]
MVTKPSAYGKIPDLELKPSSIQISSIKAVFPDPVKGSVSLKLVVPGESPTKLKATYDVKRANTPVKWNLTPNFSLKPGATAALQIWRRHLWKSTLFVEVSISFQHAQEWARFKEGKAYKLADKPEIFVEFNTQHDAFQGVLESSVKKIQGKTSVLDHLGKSRRFLETILGFGVALSEIDGVAKALLACVDVVYRNLDEQDQCDKLVLDLADSMARTLGYIEDVGQFARVYQLKRSIEEVTPLMEATANFILMFTNRSNRSGFVHSWRDRDQVDELVKSYNKFKDQFDRGLAVQSGINLETMLENMASTKGDELLQQLKPTGLETGTPVGECMRGTREDIISSIETWLDDFKAPNILWVRGFPGVGKSAIASTMVTRIRASHRLGSSFVFERSKSTVTTTSALWRKVAYDLARAYPTVRTTVVARLDEESVQPGSSSVKVLFHSLIEDPLNKSDDIPLGRLPVVIIDAVDECGGLDGRQSADRVALLQSLKHWSRLPARFKLLVTSRVEDDILRVLSPICSAIDISSGATVVNHASDDIRLFLKSRLSKIAKKYPNSLNPSWPGETTINDLTTRAAGLFVWAKTAVDFIDAGEPNEQLHQVLKGGTGLADVATLYTHILNTSFKKPSQDVIHSIRVMIGSTILAKVPLHRLECIDLLNIQPSMLDYIRNGLQSVMEAGDILRFTHHSFADFMIDREKCPPQFLIDEDAQQQLLTSACLQAMKTSLCFNICSFESSHIRNDSIEDLDSRIHKFIPAHLSYACRFWADHLDATESDLNVIDEVGYFFNENFLFWLEVLSLRKELKVVIPTLWMVIKWFPVHSTHPVVAFAKDALKFMAAFGPVIAQSIPHIYLSALPFTPRNSLVFKQYSPRFPKTLQLQMGEVLDWPAIQYVAQGHTNTVYSVAFARNGKYFASGSKDTTIRIWDTETGSLIAGPLKGHKESVNSVAFSFDDTMLVSGSSDNSVRVWDVEVGEMVSPELIGHTEEVMSVAFSKDAQRVASGSGDRTIRVWDVTTSTLLLAPFVGHRDTVAAVAFSPDQRYIVSGSYDRSIIVWEAETGQRVAGPLVAHAAKITSLAFSPSGDRLASGSGDWTIIIWDLKTWSTMGEPFEGHIDVVTSVAFSPDEGALVSGSQDETIRIWDVQTGRLSAGPFRGHSDRVAAVAFSWDGRRVASSSYDKTIRVWDTAARNTSDSIKSDSSSAHADGVNSVAISPDGKFIASGSDDLTVRIWDAKTGAPWKEPFVGHTSFVDTVAISPDSRTVASGSDDSNIFVWEVETGNILAQFLGHKAGITCVRFSPDSTRIVSSSYDKTVRVWDIHTGESLHQPFVGHTAWVTSVAFSPDGKHVASGSYDDNVFLWDIENGSITQRISGLRNGINCIAFSPDGKHVAYGSGYDIRIWEIITGDITGKFSGHTNLVVSLSYSPDGKCIASSSDDKTIRLWDVATGKLTQEPLEGHSGGVDSVAFSPDGHYIVSGSEDESIRIWSVSKSNENGSSGIVDQRLAHDWKLQNGWVINSENSLIFWVPPWNRAGLWYPRNTTVIAELPTKLNFGQFASGSLWSTCHDGILRILLPSTDPSAKEILWLIAECGSAKEVLIAIQEAVEILNHTLHDDNDDEEEGTHALSLPNQLTTLIQLASACIPRIKLRRKPASETIRPLLSQLESAISLSGTHSSRKEGRALVASVSELVQKVELWVKSLVSEDSGEIKVCTEILKTLLDTAIVACEHCIKASLAQRSFESLLPKFRIRSSIEPGWEEGEEVIRNATLANDFDFPPMRVAAMGLIKEAVLEALARPPNPFASPMFFDVFGSTVFRPSPPDLLTDQSLSIESLQDSFEAARLIELLGTYYTILSRDTANLTHLRNPDALHQVETTLLNPLRLSVRRWNKQRAMKGAHLDEMVLGSLEMSLERVDSVVVKLRSTQPG